MELILLFSPCRLGDLNRIETISTTLSEIMVAPWALLPLLAGEECGAREFGPREQSVLAETLAKYAY
jgi:hypothetical protein